MLVVKVSDMPLVMITSLAMAMASALPTDLSSLCSHSHTAAVPIIPSGGFYSQLAGARYVCSQPSVEPLFLAMPYIPDSCVCFYDRIISFLTNL